MRYFCLRLLTSTRVARVREPSIFIGRAAGGCRLACVYVVTHLTLLKLIIALMVQEVKRLSSIVNFIFNALIHKEKHAHV
jgi:hypothetical protein